MHSYIARALAFALPTITLVALQQFGGDQPSPQIATSILGSSMSGEDAIPVVKPAIPPSATPGAPTYVAPAEGVWTSRHLDEIEGEPTWKVRSTMVRFADIEEAGPHEFNQLPSRDEPVSRGFNDRRSVVTKPKPVITKLPPVTDVSKAESPVAPAVPPTPAVPQTPAVPPAPAATPLAKANDEAPSASIATQPQPSAAVASTPPKIDPVGEPEQTTTDATSVTSDVAPTTPASTSSVANAAIAPSIQSVLKEQTDVAVASESVESHLAVAQMESPILTYSSATYSDNSTPSYGGHRQNYATAKQTQTASEDVTWRPVDLRNVEVNTAGVVEQESKAYEATKDDKVLAERAIQSGFELVQRRANYSARARFIEAMRIVARSLDEQTYSTRHSAALRRGLKAYDEASDFFPSSRHPDDEVNLYLVVGGHETPILQNAETASLSPRLCVREYMAYAEQELQKALGNEPLASQALYGLGRLESAMETTATSSTSVRAHRSLMLHQAALRVDRSNFASANELGVLLARYGQYDNAIAALRHCVTLSPQQPTAWRNLASIYRSLGRIDESRMAEANANRTMASQPRTPFVATQPRVEWVDVDAFARIPAVEATPRPASTPTNVARAPQPVQQTNPTQTANRETLRMKFFGR